MSYLNIRCFTLAHNEGPVILQALLDLRNSCDCDLCNDASETKHMKYNLHDDILNDLLLYSFEAKNFVNVNYLYELGGDFKIDEIITFREDIKVIDKIIGMLYPHNKVKFTADLIKFRDNKIGNHEVNVNVLTHYINTKLNALN